jgi:pimeloyl-ACP methyl ester carboxylesterase
MVSANGARFHVVEAGRGPLVLFLHGFPENWWAWRAQLPALAAAGWRAAAVDLRGYGESDKPPRGYDPLTLSADIAGVVRSLGAADAVLVGHDWGGLLAWTAAVTHPKVVRRLCAVSAPHPLRLRASVVAVPRQLRSGAHVLGYQLPALPERRLLRDDAAGIADFLRRWSAPGWPSPEEEQVYRAAALVPGVTHSALEYFRWAVRSLARPDGLRYARVMRAPVRVPVLQLHGALDRLVLPRVAARSVQHVEAPYRWRLLDAAGHFPHEEVPDVFTSELLGWLSDPEPDR